MASDTIPGATDPPATESAGQMPATNSDMPLERASGLPSMRFEGGDVAIHFTDNPNCTLLLHSEVLRTVPWFRAGMESPWNKSYMVTDPATGKERKVWSYWLNTREDTFWLEQGTPAFERDERGLLPDGAMFIHSGMSELDGTRFNNVFNDTPGAFTVHDLRVLFAIIYNIEVTLDDLIENTTFCMPTQYSHKGPAQFLPLRIANILALAIWFDVEEKTASKLADMVVKDPQVWDLVHHDPSQWAEIAKLLGNRPLYVDTLRHCFSSEKRHWMLPSMEDVLEMSKEDTKHILDQHDQYAKSMEDSLRKELQALALPNVDVLYSGSRMTWRTTVLNALTHRTRKVDKKQQRVEFVARSIWSQYVTQCFDEKGCYIVRRTGMSAGRSKPSGVPCTARCMQAILDAPNSEDPCYIFGHKVVKEHVAMFGKDVLDGESLQTKLLSIIREAGAIIERYEANDPTGKTAKSTAKGGMIVDHTVTWALVPVDTMPWERRTTEIEGESDDAADDDEAGGDSKSTNEMPRATLKVPTYKPHSHKLPIKPAEVSLKTADKEWLQALGLYREESEEDDDSTDSEE